MIKYIISIIIIFIILLFIKDKGINNIDVNEKIILNKLILLFCFLFYFIYLLIFNKCNFKYLNYINKIKLSVSILISVFYFILSILFINFFNNYKINLF